MNLRSSRPSSPRNDASVWARGAAAPPLAARTISRTKPGDCSRSPALLAGRVAHQDHVEGHAPSPAAAPRAVNGVRGEILAGGGVRPVRGIGIHDGVGQEHHSDLGPRRVGQGEALGPEEGVVEVRPLPVAAVAADVVHGDSRLPPKRIRRWVPPSTKPEHLLQRLHPLLVGVEGRERGGVVHEEEDHRALARGRRGGGAFARQRGARLESESEQGGQHRGPTILHRAAPPSRVDRYNPRHEGGNPRALPRRQEHSVPASHRVAEPPAGQSSGG